MFKYRLFTPDGDEIGEATYALMIQPGEEIHLGNGRRFRVLDVVPFDEGGRIAVRRTAAGRSRVVLSPPTANDGSSSGTRIDELLVLGRGLFG